MNSYKWLYIKSNQVVMLVPDAFLDIAAFQEQIKMAFGSWYATNDQTHFPSFHSYQKT